MREFVINENDAGQRLDKFISKLMPQLPKSMMYRGLRKNCVKLNGRHVKDGSVFIDEADELQLYFKDEFFEPEKEFKYIKPKLDIVYEDKNILVVNKEVGAISHSDGRSSGNTLIDMIKSYLFENNEYDPSTEHTFKPSLCNRLDRNTGGLVIAAKNAVALREMNAKLRNREVRKFYKAVVEGYPKDKGHLEGYSTRMDNITTVSADFSTGSKAVSLDYKVIAKKDGYSLAEIELHTGRTHQIRAQFSAAGYPLAGDTKYGGHGGMFRQSLWSVRLEFEFKETVGEIGYLNGKKIEVESPFEKHFLLNSHRCCDRMED